MESPRVDLPSGIARSRSPCMVIRTQLFIPALGSAIFCFGQALSIGWSLVSLNFQKEEFSFLKVQINVLELSLISLTRVYTHPQTNPWS